VRAGSGVCGRVSDREEDYQGEYQSPACQDNTTASDDGSIAHRNRALTRGKASPGLRSPTSCPGWRRENGPWRGAMDSIRGPGRNKRGQQDACLTPAATAATGGTLQTLFSYTFRSYNLIVIIIRSIYFDRKAAMASRICGCICESGLFLTSYQRGSVRVSLRNLDLVGARCCGRRRVYSVRCRSLSPRASRSETSE